MFSTEDQTRHDRVTRLLGDSKVSAAYERMGEVMATPAAATYRKDLDKARWDLAGAFAEAGVGLERYALVNTAAGMLTGKSAYRS